jgi:hypothetical protein
MQFLRLKVKSEKIERVLIIEIIKVKPITNWKILIAHKGYVFK